MKIGAAVKRTSIFTFDDEEEKVSVLKDRREAKEVQRFDRELSSSQTGVKAEFARGINNAAKVASHLPSTGGVRHVVRRIQQLSQLPNARKETAVYLTDSIMRHLADQAETELMERYEKHLEPHLKNVFKRALRADLTRRSLAEKFLNQILVKWKDKGWFEEQIDGIVDIVHRNCDESVSLPVQFEQPAFDQELDHMGQQPLGGSRAKASAPTPAQPDWLKPGMTPFKDAPTTPVGTPGMNIGPMTPGADYLKQGYTPIPATPTFQSIPGTPRAALYGAVPQTPGGSVPQTPGMPGMTPGVPAAIPMTPGAMPFTPGFVGPGGIPMTPGAGHIPGTPGLGNPFTPAGPPPQTPAGPGAAPFTPAGQPLTPAGPGWFQPQTPSSPGPAHPFTPRGPAPLTPGGLPSTPGSVLPMTPGSPGYMQPFTPGGPPPQTPGGLAQPFTPAGPPPATPGGPSQPFTPRPPASAAVGGAMPSTPVPGTPGFMPFAGGDVAPLTPDRPGGMASMTPMGGIPMTPGIGGTVPMTPGFQPQAAWNVAVGTPGMLGGMPTTPGMGPGAGSIPMTPGVGAVPGTPGPAPELQQPPPVPGTETPGMPPAVAAVPVAKSDPQQPEPIAGTETPGMPGAPVATIPPQQPDPIQGTVTPGVVPAQRPQASSVPLQPEPMPGTVTPGMPAPLAGGMTPGMPPAGPVPQQPELLSGAETPAVAVPVEAAPRMSDLPEQPVPTASIPTEPSPAEPGRSGGPEQPVPSADGPAQPEPSVPSASLPPSSIPTIQSEEATPVQGGDDTPFGLQAGGAATPMLPTAKRPHPDGDEGEGKRQKLEEGVAQPGALPSGEATPVPHTPMGQA